MCISLFLKDARLSKFLARWLTIQMVRNGFSKESTAKRGARHFADIVVTALPRLRAFGPDPLISCRQVVGPKLAKVRNPP